MKPAITSFLCNVALVAAVEQAAYLNLPLERRISNQGISKRQIANGSVFLSTEQASYLATISIGTPSQQVQLIVDTGSPLTWVNAANVSTFTPGSSTVSSSNTAAGAAICQRNTCFRATTSSSLTIPSNTTVFDIQYVDGTESIGRMVQDTLTFQGLTDTTFQLGLVEYFYSPGGTASSIGGILGLSPDNPVLNFDSIDDALVSDGSSSSTTISSFNPPTILDQLQSEGKINSLAFSLFLDEATGGQLTLGGVDSGRYSGALTVLPLVNDPSTSGTSYQVTLRAVGSGGGNTVTVGELFVLDSGTTSMYLPASTVQQLASSLNGYFVPYSTSSGLLGIPCTVSTTIDFYFANNAVIRVPTSVLLESRISASAARRLGVNANADVCLLNLFGTTDDSSYLLGDAFLRSCYVVYNIAQNQLAVAQAIYNEVSTVLPITADEFGIPNAIYNSSSPSPSNSAVIPAITRSVALPTAGGVRTSVGNGGTLTFTTSAATGASTSSSSAATRMHSSSTFSPLYAIPFGLALAGFFLL